MSGAADITSRVVGVVAEALDHPREKVTLDASLVDDHGAESIDLHDNVFRLETEFGIDIPENEIWRGALGDAKDEAAALAARLAELRAARPDFRWDRFPEKPTAHDLPRLLTPRTIVEYLERRL